MCVNLKELKYENKVTLVKIYCGKMHKKKLVFENSRTISNKKKPKFLYFSYNKNFKIKIKHVLFCFAKINHTSVNLVKND